MDNNQILEEYSKYNSSPSGPVTGGNVAYDLSRFDQRASVRKAIESGEQEQTLTRTVTRTVPRPRISFSVLMLILVIAGMAALLIYNNMRLTILTDDLSVLSNEYKDLKNEQISLQTQSDQRYTLNDIETYAVNVLGMKKIDSSMIEYIELSNPDTITKVDPYESDKLTSFFNNILSKLKELLEFLT